MLQIQTVQPYPVMIWIHGGALKDGSAEQWGVEGVVRNLVSRDVVVVIIQYRLGTLGFFTTMNSEFPANLGMLDQVEAIKFVVAHIKNFGGDPNRLTLFGESAGAASVSAHTYSPLSQHLFQQAIMQSGTVMICLNGVLGESKNSEKVAKLICNITLPATGDQLS
uniref:Carboxylic ester hydrolase n=1 Tax=Parascaris equorum TaxID=6256 RepID=A0A914RXF1_PAREQ